MSNLVSEHFVDTTVRTSHLSKQISPIDCDACTTLLSAPPSCPSEVREKVEESLLRERMTPASYIFEHPFSQKAFCGEASKTVNNVPVKNSKSCQQYCPPCMTRIAHEELNSCDCTRRSLNTSNFNNNGSRNNLNASISSNNCTRNDLTASKSKNNRTLHDLNASNNSNNCPCRIPNQKSFKMSCQFTDDGSKNARSMRCRIVDDAGTEHLASADDSPFHSDSRYRCPIDAPPSSYLDEGRGNVRKEMCVVGEDNRRDCVIQPIKDHPKYMDSKLATSLGIVKERASRSAHPIYMNPMLPGYAGHVPLEYKQLGRGYETSTMLGIAEFDEAVNGQSITHKHHWNDNNSNQNNCPFESDVCKDMVINRMNQQCATQTHNPYKMKNDAPNKYYIPGYGGHVPMTYNRPEPFAVMTRKGLNAFTDYQKAAFPQHQNFDSETGATTTCKPEYLAPLTPNHCSKTKGCR